jgi:hypothetical protein
MPTTLPFAQDVPLDLYKASSGDIKAKNHGYHKQEDSSDSYPYPVLSSHRGAM